MLYRCIAAFVPWNVILNPDNSHNMTVVGWLHENDLFLKIEALHNKWGSKYMKVLLQTGVVGYLFCPRISTWAWIPVEQNAA